MSNSDIISTGTTALTGSDSIKLSALLRKIVPQTHSGLGPGMGFSNNRSRITSLGELRVYQPASRAKEIPSGATPGGLYTTSGEHYEAASGVAVSLIHLHYEQAYWSPDNQRLCSSMNGMQGRSAKGVNIHGDTPIRDCAVINQYGRRVSACPFSKPKSDGGGKWSRPDCTRMIKAVVVIGDCEDLVTVTFKGSSWKTGEEDLMSLISSQASLWSRQFVVYTEPGDRPTYHLMKVKLGELNSDENNAIYERLSAEYSAKYDEMCQGLYTIREPAATSEPAPVEAVTSTLDSDEDPDF